MCKNLTDAKTPLKTASSATAAAAVPHYTERLSIDVSCGPINEDINNCCGVGEAADGSSGEYRRVADKAD